MRWSGLRRVMPTASFELIGVRKMVRAIDRLIELDERESAIQHDRIAFLSFMDAVIEALPDGLIVTDLEGKITLFNERAEFMFGRHRSEVIGQNVELLMPERLRKLHANDRHMFNRFDLSPHSRTMGLGLQLTGIRSDGHEFPTDVTLARMVVPRGVFNLALVRYSPRLLELAAAERAASGREAEPVAVPARAPEGEASDGRI
jgi:PAS domain S-box-containing protein